MSEVFFMRYLSLRLNLKPLFSAAAVLGAVCVAIFAAAHISASEELPERVNGNFFGMTVSDTACHSAEESGHSADDGADNAASNADGAYGGEADMSMEDVGGEFVSDCSVYDGNLSIPAHISLDRITISDAVAKPLDTARVSSLFGYRCNPVSGKYSFHSGYDLAAPHGANIYAMYSGRVTKASYDSGYGNFIIIEHSSGFQSLYAHCSKLLCSEGDTVEGGERIALVGSTGNSTGAHLHVEFRRDGKRFDPEWILGGIY